MKASLAETGEIGREDYEAFLEALPF